MMASAPRGKPLGLAHRLLLAAIIVVDDVGVGDPFPSHVPGAAPYRLPPRDVAPAPASALTVTHSVRGSRTSENSRRGSD